MSDVARTSVDVYLELGKKRVFACACEWPGWCRSAKSEQMALEHLDAYRDRYGAVAAQAAVPFMSAGVEFNVVERVAGSATTDFGAPDSIPSWDLQPVSRSEAERLGALVKASWTIFDGIVARAPSELRKGPRGGGRDRDKIVDHVLAAEARYARKMGVRHREPRRDDIQAIAALRRDIMEVLTAAWDGTPLVPNGWPPRCAGRRIAWHVLDHLWEIEDRSRD